MTKCVEVNKERYKSKLINDVLAIEGGVGGGIVPWASNSSKKHDLGDEFLTLGLAHRRLLFVVQIKYLSFLEEIEPLFVHMNKVFKVVNFSCWSSDSRRS